MPNSSSHLGLEINHLQLVLGGHSLNYHQFVKQGETITLQGVSGVGKSSLLLCLAGFVNPQQGQIKWLGEDITYSPIERRPIAMLFQENNLFEHLSVMQNLSLAMNTIKEAHLKSTFLDEIKQSALELGISDHLTKMPTQLSGGQRQRVSILRTLLRPEPIILLDEPFAELDNETRLAAANWVAQKAKKYNKTLLLVTHQEEDVQRLADRNWQIE